MSTAIWVVIAVVAVLAVAAIVLVTQQRSRTARLRDRFGPEYDRALEQHGKRGEAERELLSRETRHQELGVRPLDPAQQKTYREQWTQVQERFVDAPEATLEEADKLVLVVMGERGYPVEDYEDRVAHLSVEHGRALDHYRRAHDISTRARRKEASTEDLRQGMVHYRTLFEDLLAVPDRHTDTAPAEVQPDPGPEKADTARADRADEAPGAAPAPEGDPADRVPAGPAGPAGAERPAPSAERRS
ncbi:hypothetical protein [Actinomadura craniellae]|uniref:hypothetical protein n=1 Tax=Actinomadura craniellae TaxID=2231787 RepID=UPI0018F114EC|nr:hypothetical protein [Actinomadura craniellae]